MYLEFYIIRISLFSIFLIVDKKKQITFSYDDFF